MKSSMNLHRGTLLFPLPFLLLAGVGWILFFASCAPSIETRYFKTLTKDTTISAYITPGLDTRIRKDDILGINISSISHAEDDLFNVTPTPGVEKPGYPLDKDGNIHLHRIGTIHAEGLTRKELATQIKKDLEPYLTDAIVSVYYLNRKVTVAGEITSPKVLPMPEDQMTLIDALVNCGDFKITSLRTDLLIIRDSSDKKVVKHVNMEDHAILNSPWFYLQPNDIVIVNPDTRKAEREDRRTRFQANWALITSGVSLILIVLSRFL